MRPMRHAACQRLRFLWTAKYIHNNQLYLSQVKHTNATSEYVTLFSLRYYFAGYAIDTGTHQVGLSM